VENVALPHTQSVGLLPPAVPLDHIPTEFSASPAETAHSNRQMLLYSVAAVLVIVIALVLALS
jgi:hypothetical protein